MSLLIDSDFILLIFVCLCLRQNKNGNFDRPVAVRPISIKQVSAIFCYYILCRHVDMIHVPQSSPRKGDSIKSNTLWRL